MRSFLALVLVFSTYKVSANELSCSVIVETLKQISNQEKNTVAKLVRSADEASELLEKISKGKVLEKDLIKKSHNSSYDLDRNISRAKDQWKIFEWRKKVMFDALANCQ